MCTNVAGECIHVAHGTLDHKRHVAIDALRIDFLVGLNRLVLYLLEMAVLTLGTGGLFARITILNERRPPRYRHVGGIDHTAQRHGRYS
jgi:hypothetical protein